MAAVILEWNAERRNRWDCRAAVEQVARSGKFLHSWPLEHRWNIQPGTEAWLMLRSSSDAGTGLMGHGVVMSGPYDVLPPGEDDAPEWFVTVAIDALLPPGEQIRPDTLRAAVPHISWDGGTYDSIMTVPASAEATLRQLWRDMGPTADHPAQVVPGTFAPDTVSSVDLNRYERAPDARGRCLAFHGTACAACGFSFEASFGDIGRGFIDVHHIVPPALLSSGYQLDPVADLVPLCPNCHAMVHYGVTSPRTVSELRNILSASGHLRGEVVPEGALEAQENAARILEERQSGQNP